MGDKGINCRLVYHERQGERDDLGGGGTPKFWLGARSRGLTDTRCLCRLHSK